MHQLDIIESEIKDIKDLFTKFTTTSNPVKQIRIVDQDELAKELKVTKQTIINWQKRGKIPSIRVGSCARYNIYDVLDALQK